MNPAADSLRSPPESGSFDRACGVVLSHLSRTLPMGLWAVTRVADDRQVMLAVDSPGYAVEVGTELQFSTSLCAAMTSGRVPAVGPAVAAAPAYTHAVDAAERLGFRVRAYAGAPIVGPAGELFGTVCGFNGVEVPGLTDTVGPRLEVLAGLLSIVLAGDLALTSAHRDIERAHDLADVDELTGLLNRRGWSRLLEAEEARFRRFGDPAAVVVIDLDDLKSTNDEHGHHEGDRLLRAVAALLRSITRATDVVARLGGDEFGIVAVGTGEERAELFVQRLEEHFHQAGVAASIGLAPHTVAAGLRDAWERADRAMYAEKRRRRAGHPSRRPVHSTASQSAGESPPSEQETTSGPDGSTRP